MNKNQPPTRESILAAAQACVCGDRDEAYGTPEDSFKVIAKYWKNYIEDNCVVGNGEVRVSSKDVAAMMILFKVARISTGTAHEDNWVDIAGYAACGGECEG